MARTTLPHLNLARSPKPHQCAFSPPLLHPSATSTTSLALHHIHLPLPLPRSLPLHCYTIHLEVTVSSLFYLFPWETDFGIEGSTMENHSFMAGLLCLLYFIDSRMLAFDKEKSEVVRLSGHLQPCEQVLNKTTNLYIY